MRNTVRAFVAFVAMLLAVPAMAGIFSPQDLNVLFGQGRSLTNWHGSSAFTSVHFEGLSKSPRLLSKLGANTELVAAISYSDVRQPRSWFGHRDGDPDDHVRAESLFVGARKNWRSNARIGLFMEMGTGPMWSNRRIPAATSRLNFDSQLGLGVALRTPKTPLYFVYRFEHVSNGGIVHRNPGLQVFSFAVGTRALKLKR